MAIQRRIHERIQNEIFWIAGPRNHRIRAIQAGSRWITGPPPEEVQTRDPDPRTRISLLFMHFTYSELLLDVDVYNH
jgi:hypothetical protein